MKDWKTFFYSLIAVLLLPCFLFVGVAEALLHRVCEDKVGTQDAIDLQLRDKALYGSALSGDVSFLKYGIVKAARPDILAIGSSRVMQFRKAFFKNASFYTMGGLVNSIGDLQHVCQEVIKIYTPQIIIIEASWDWLNPNCLHKMQETPLLEGNGMGKRIYLYKHLCAEFVKNKKIREQVLRPRVEPVDTIGNRPTIGLMAAAEFRGFREDGSFQYGDRILEPKSVAERLADTHERIKNGNRRFERADKVDQNELAKLKYLIHEVKMNGCHVIVILPPLPNEIYQTLMDSTGHSAFMRQYEQGVREVCEYENVSFLDCSNMAWLGATDEEALDGFHGSERTYGRIVLRLLEDKNCAPYINETYIRQRMEESESPIHIVPYDS